MNRFARSLSDYEGNGNSLGDWAGKETGMLLGLNREFDEAGLGQLLLGPGDWLPWLSWPFALEVWILLTANGVFQILLYRISSIIAHTLILSIQYGPTGGSVIFNRCHLQVEKVFKYNKKNSLCYSCYLKVF